MAKQENVLKSVSQVSLDHFNPEGVRELSRSLSKSSARIETTSVCSVRSFVIDEPFSLEKALRAALYKYAYSPLNSRWSTVSHNFGRQHDSGVKRRELGVYFKNLHVTGVGATTSHQATIGSTFNPKVIWEGFRNSRGPSTRNILHDFNGVVKPGEMLREFLPSLCDPQPYARSHSLSCVGYSGIWMHNVP